MTKTKYDVGDILTYCVDGRRYATAVIVKWHITSMYIDGITLEQHTDYDLFIKSDGSNFRFAHEVPECAFYNYKIAGHIDISGMPEDTVKNNLIDATAHEFCEERIPYAILAHWDIMKMNEKNCCCDGDKLKEEDKMAEEIYKVGDILEIPGNVVLPRQFGIFPKEETCRCLVLNVLHHGSDSISYTFLTHKDGFGTFNIVGVGHANIADCAKLIGHCDISALRYEKPDERSGDTDLLMLFTAGTIAQVADLRNELDKIKKENEELKAENKVLSDTLSKSEAKAQSRLDRNEVLKRENEELRGHNEKLCQALSESEADNAMLKSQIACMEGRIESLAQKHDQLDADNRYLSTRVKHLTISNNSLRANLAEETSKRMQAEAELNEKAEQVYQLKKENEDFRTSNKELSESLSNSEMKAHSRLNEISFLTRKINKLESANNDLETELYEKAEELKKVYSSDLACEINRLREANEKLSTENERLSNAQRYLDLFNENKELKAMNNELEDKNAKYLQSMTCARKQMTEAAKCICEAEEHMDVAIYYK